MSELTQALEIILAREKRIYPPTVAKLNPGLTKNEIDNITKDWLIKIPTEVYELYQWKNGVGGGSKTYELGGLFERWSFEPLQNLSIEKQPSPYDYPPDTPFYSLNMFFSYESCFRGYVLFNKTRETQWVELVDIVDGFHDRMWHYTPFFYYKSLTSMILTIAESYEKAYFKDSQGIWKINEEIYKTIWCKYNSSKLSESTLNKFFQKPDFNFINQLIRNNIVYLDPRTQEPLVQILQKIALNTQDKAIKQIITKILGEGANRIPCIFEISNLLEEYWKIRELSLLSFQKLHLQIEENFYPEQDIKQIEQKRREQNIKRATIFVLFLLQEVNILIQALEYDDTEIRIEAAWALGEITDYRAAEPLIKAWHDDDTVVIETARRSILKIISKHPELENIMPF